MTRVTLIASVVVLGAFTNPLSANASDCENVRGTLAAHSTGADSFESVLTGGLEGLLLGTNFRIVKVGEDGTLHGVVDHEFITTRGTFYTFADVVLSPNGPNIYRTSERNSFLPGGTGAFEGANGTLLIQASIDFSTGEGSGRYHGRICTGRQLAAAPVEADFTTIDFPGATSTVPLDINPGGDIVGRYLSGDGSTHGFFRSALGAFTTVDFPGAIFTVAAGTNARGDIVGMYRLPTDGPRVRHGFLLTEGAFTTVDPPGAAFTNALGINSQGHIVGRFCTTVATPCTPDGGNVHGFLFAAGQFMTVDFPDAIRTNAWKIDPQGTIVGGYTGSDGKNHIFVLTEGGFTTVALPPTIGIPLENGGINPKGDIAGTYCDGAPCTPTSTDVHGFLLSRGEFTSVNVPGAVSTAAFAVNPRGDIVGFYDDTSGRRHGFLLSHHE
jgi:hypothetical protein